MLDRRPSNIPPSGAVEESHKDVRGTGKDDHALTDFFNPEVVQLALRDPTTAHRLKTFCQTSACAENMDFLEKIDRYSLLLEQLADALSVIQQTFLTPDSEEAINIPDLVIRSTNTDIDSTRSVVIPKMSRMFAKARDHIESLVAEDIYPRFVRHQLMLSTRAALATDKSPYVGLGDSFCLTDPSATDNPIVFASDGFVHVTGYERWEIVRRNCRFLQGPLTDKVSVRRLATSINTAEETVELLLNYRKNGDPFWNLLHVTPLYDEWGKLSYYLGGQINCSSTIHNRADVINVLNCKDPDSSDAGHPQSPPLTVWDAKVKGGEVKPRQKPFMSWRKNSKGDLHESISVMPDPGMEKALIRQLAQTSFKTQASAFQRAYSKFLVLKYSQSSGGLSIEHYSPGVVDALCPVLPNGDAVPIYHWDMVKLLVERFASTSSTTTRSFKTALQDNLSKGKAVSIPLKLLAGDSTQKPRHEVQYVSHWTPCKDLESKPKYVVLVLART